MLSQGWAPQTLSSESQRGGCPQDLQEYRKQAALNEHRGTSHKYPSLPSSPRPRAQHRGSRQNAHLPAFPQKGFDYILYKLLPESRASNFHISRNWLLSSTVQGEPEGTSAAFSLQPATMVKPGHQHLSGRSLYTQMVPQLLELPPGGHKPRSPDSDSNGACILNSTRTIVEKLL